MGFQDNFQMKLLAIFLEWNGLYHFSSIGPRHSRIHCCSIDHERAYDSVSQPAKEDSFPGDILIAAAWEMGAGDNDGKRRGNRSGRADAGWGPGLVHGQIWVDH